MPGDDRHMLQAIHDHCAAQCRAVERAGADARRKLAYARVARAARELLEEMEA